MGGGASHGSLEGLLASTLLVGRAIASIYRNPGMYRLNDFHSALAPRLRSNNQQNPFVFFGQDEDDEDDPRPEPDPVLYEHLFHVTVNDETLYFDDVCMENEAGWTPLHTCCMSFHTAQAGLLIVAEMQRRGVSLDTRTQAGPGTFNKGWTALHMACAYNVEPLVEKLLACGAECNTMNCFGYSPLLEACHRGYLPVVDMLMRAGADLSHVPPDHLSNQSPFAAAPAHSALGESARCGFSQIVAVLLRAGAAANIDTCNSLGWTPLHEAVFYNRKEVATALLEAGANASIRTRSGALAYHLSGLEEVRALIAAKGGPGSVPADGDTVNMLDILHEITVGASRSGSGGGQPVFTMQFLGDEEDEEDEEEDDDDEEEEVLRLMQLMSSEMTQQFDDMDMAADEYERRLTDQVKPGPAYDDEEEEDESGARQARGAEEKHSTPGKGGRAGRAGAGRDIREYAADDFTSEPALLHSGPLLGNLPALKGGASPDHVVQRAGRAAAEALQLGDNGGVKNEKKDKKKKKKAKLPADVPGDMPTKFLCQLSRRPMQEPVQSIYGNIFELSTILMWFHQQGQICPLTGAPLVAADLKALPELAEEIMQWTLNKSMQRQAAEVQQLHARPAPTVAAAAAPRGQDDELYDF